MHAKDLVINKSSHWQAIEAICKCLPKADIKPSLALVIKPIYSVDGSTLMVAPKKEKVLRVFNFVCKEKANGLYALLITVHIIPKEEIICCRWESTIFKKPKKIRILTMDISRRKTSKSYTLLVHVPIWFDQTRSPLFLSQRLSNGFQLRRHRNSSCENPPE
uniref:Uncharacterized protein n=1 Tax=Nelumbo nucifera TaxID=4432 RepID=A0A822Z7R3_NELNU|nr:TPA_asm: hypothetical protein HUJ06_013349 [Nelumbo nucifera]